jgi:hypothetical protein
VGVLVKMAAMECADDAGKCNIHHQPLLIPMKALKPVKAGAAVPTARKTSTAFAKYKPNWANLEFCDNGDLRPLSPELRHLHQGTRGPAYYFQ